MEKKLLTIVKMQYSHSQSGAFTLILEETEGNRRLPIVIGNFEAQSIALGIERLKPKRPLTHDLMKNFAEFFGIKIIEVIIHKFQDGIFYALLICDQNGTISEIDSRTSDAIALAIRFGCPIYTYESILEEAGIVMQDDVEEDEETEADEQEYEDEGELTQYMTSELEAMLQTAIEQENFEQASILRDEIQKRKQKE